MFVSVETIDAMLLDNAPGMIYISDEWEGTKDRSVKTFVLEVAGKLYKGTIVKTITQTPDVEDKKGKIITKGGFKTTYSHEENNGVDAYEVQRVCVKRDGKRVIEYR